MKEFLKKYSGILLQLLLLTGFFTAGMLLNRDAVQRFWSSLLIANWFFLLISVSGIFIMSLHYLTGAAWSEPLLPILREFKRGIPLISFSFLIMLPGAGSLFRTLDNSSMQIISIAIITVTATALMFFVYFFDELFRKKQFTEKQRSITELILLIPALYLMSRVWIRDLNQQFPNPVFVFYLICSSVLMGLCISGILFAHNYKSAIESDNKILQNLGRYLMAMLMIRAYLWFSQSIITGYAGISEELSFLPENSKIAAYQGTGILLSFLIPFFLLLFGKVKRNPAAVFYISILILAGQYFDLYYQVFNSSGLQNCSLSLIDVSVFYGFTLMFLLYIRNRKLSF